MTRLHHVKARKDYPEAGIKKGEMYYWWIFNFSRIRHKSKERPKRSQYLTQSYFLASIYDMEDTISDLKADEDLEDNLQMIKEGLEEMRDEEEEKFDNMPEQLQYDSYPERRKEALEEWISELESIDVPSVVERDEELEEEDDEDYKTYREELESALDEIQATGYGGD
jgi:molecular chaperone DnaK (HSP70)